MTHCVAQLRTFSNKTLQDNWFEDRVQAGLEVNQFKPVNKNELSLMFSSCSSDPERLEHLTRHEWPDSRRTLPILPVADQSRFTSTYKATSMETIEQKKSLRKDTGKKFLVNRLNVGSAIRTQRTLKNGDTLLPRHPPSKDAKYFESTNSMMYGKNPDSVRENWSSKPLPEKGNDNRFIGGYAAKCSCSKVYLAAASSRHLSHKA